MKFIINDKIYGIIPSANIKYSPKINMINTILYLVLKTHKILINIPFKFMQIPKVHVKCYTLYVQDLTFWLDYANLNSTKVSKI